MSELVDDVASDDVDDVAIEHGPGVGPETERWARERGFKLGLQNRIVVTKVRDLNATLEVFKAAYPPRYLRQEVEPFLGRLPLVLDLSWPDTALLLDALHASDAFDYEVNP